MIANITTDSDSVFTVLDKVSKTEVKTLNLIITVNRPVIRNLSEIFTALKNFSGNLSVRIEQFPFSQDIMIESMESLINLDIVFSRILFFEENCKPIRMSIRNCLKLQSITFDSIMYDDKFFYSAPIDLVIDNTPSLQSICCGRQGIQFNEFSNCGNLSFLQGNCVQKIHSLPPQLKVLAVSNESCEFKHQLNSGQIYVKKSIVSDLMQLKYAGPGLLCYKTKDGNNEVKIYKEFTDELLKDAPAPVVKYLINKNVLKKKSLLMSAFSSAKAIAIKN